MCPSGHTVLEDFGLICTTQIPLEEDWPMRTLLIVATAMTLSASAYAADMPMATKAPMAPMAAPPTWTGWYVGVNGGGVWDRNDPSTTVLNNNYFTLGNIPAVQAAGNTSFNSSGGLAGGQFGYLGQWGNFVAGVEAGLDWMGINSSNSFNTIYPLQTCIAPAAGCAFTTTRGIRSDWLFTLLGRAGVAFGPALPYITGGLAVSNLRYSYGFIDNNVPVFANTSTSPSSTKTGFAIGAGVDWQLAPHWTVRGEYLYVQFDGLSSTTPVLATSNGFVATTNFGVSSGTFRENIGRIAVSYSFGGPVVARY
jgi:outer membrane immunogenic protein